MAPKPPEAAAKPKAGQVKASLAMIKKKTGKWLKFPPRKCKVCGQTTHEVDRDSDKCGTPEILHWTKTATLPSGDKAPVGEECYRCCDTRIRFFEPGTTSDDIHEQNETCPVFHDRWLELRFDRVSKQKKFKHLEKLSVTCMVQKLTEDYDDKFQEGTCQCLWDFANARRLPFHEEVEGDREKLLAHIAKTYPTYDVYTDDQGVEVVDIPDQPGQRTYRYKRGRKGAISKVEKRDHDNKDTAEEQFMNLGGMRGHFGLKLEKQDAEEESHAQRDHHSQQRAHREAEMQKSPSSRPSTRLLCKQESDAKSPVPRRLTGKTSPKRFVTPPPLHARPKLWASASLGRSSASAATELVGSAASQQSPRASRRQATESEGVPDRKKRRTKAEMDLERTMDLIAKTEKSYTWEQHYAKCARRKEFETLQDQLTASARKCALQRRCDKAMQQSEIGFALNEQLSDRQEFFELLRGKFSKLVLSELREKHMAVWQDAPVEVAADILTDSCVSVLDAVQLTEDVVRTVVLVVSSMQQNRLCFASLRTGDYDHRRHAQNTIVLALADRMWRISDRGAVVAVGEVLAATLPKVTFEEVDGDDEEDDQSRVAPKHSGWFAQSLVDMGCLKLMSQVLAEDVTPQVQKDCAKLMANVSAVSSKMKLHFKAAAGSASQLGKRAYEKIQALSEKAAANATAQETIDSTMMLSNAMQLQALVDADFPKAFNNFIDLMDDHGETVEAMASVYANESDKTSPAGEADAAVLSAAAELRLAFRMLADKMCDEAGAIAKLFEKYMLPRLREKVVGKTVVKTEPEAEVDEEQKVCLLDGLKAVTGSLADFESKKHVTFEAHKRCCTLYKATILIDKVADSEVVVINYIEKFSELWQQDMATPKCARSYSAAEAGGKLQGLLNGLVREQLLDRCVVTFCDEFFINGHQYTSTLIREIQRREGALPPAAQNVCVAANTMERIETFFKRIKNGKIVVLDELTSLITSVESQSETIKTMLKSRPQYEVMMTSVRTQWATSLKKLEEQVKSLDIIAPFNDKYASLQGAVEKWNFDDCPYMVEKAKETDKEACKNVGNTVSQFVNWQHIAEKLKASVDKLGASKEDVESIERLYATIQAHEAAVNQCGKRCAEMAICTLLLSDAPRVALEHTLKFCEMHLRVPYTSLGTQVVSRVDTVLEGRASFALPSPCSTPGPASASHSVASEAKHDRPVCGLKRAGSKSSKKTED